MILDRKYKEIE